MRTFETGATRNDSDDKLDYEGFLSQPALMAFARYMHKHRIQADGGLRASDNWQKGIPMEEYMKSMHRHFMDVWQDHRNEVYDPITVEALCALFFNVQGMMHEVLKHGRVPNAAPVLDRPATDRR